MKRILWLITLMTAMTMATNVSAKETNWLETGNSDEGPYVLYNNTNSTIPYRIPALAQAVNGDIIALSDYRICKQDIGYGEVHVNARISRDNGLTWGNEFCIAGKTAVSGEDSQYYGDASIVADRENNEVLVMLVAGSVSFVNSTRNNPIRVAYLRGKYDDSIGDWTWSRPIDITTTIYNLLPNTKTLFCTSGKICQSKMIKVGSHYRIYIGLDTRPVSNTSDLNHNYVLYSDNFGETWKVLGSNTTPAIRWGDECKCEELPNGNVVLSSRIKQGRKWNIFTYTNQENATGSWGTAKSPSSANNGIYNVNDNNPCNGEILLVDAIRNSDKAKVTLALQSVAINRTNVEIWYKPLISGSDYDTPTNFAKNWEGKYQVSNTTSCYSTMIRQQDNRIGFYFEESAGNGGYDMTYYRYLLETITDGKYSFEKEVLLGDVNMDGSINITDVTAIVNIILGKDKGPTYIYDHVAADMNGDGEINIVDATILVNVILGNN